MGVVRLHASAQMSALSLTHAGGYRWGQRERPVSVHSTILNLASISVLTKRNSTLRMLNMNGDRWVDKLAEEDLAFLKRFLLASGTLKELAAEYGISYPTVRLRLDRLIEKVKLLDEASPSGVFEAELMTAFAQGAIDERTFRTLLGAHRSDIEKTAGDTHA